jgi:hypothetical protein
MRKELLVFLFSKLFSLGYFYEEIFGCVLVQNLMNAREDHNLEVKEGRMLKVISTLFAFYCFFFFFFF